MDDKLPEGVILEMKDELLSCEEGCYFFTHPLENCPKEYAEQSRRIPSCINGRNIIFKQVREEHESE